MSKDKRVLKIKQIIGCKKSNMPAMIPMCASKWWKLVRVDIAPKPIKIGRNTYWFKEDIESFMDSYRI